MPSGHAYAKALRTVKTCVGSEWCRFGTQDCTQMGKDLERALWRMYAPHKVKLAVSGCPRNCAESGIKDVGVIGVDSGWELYVAGNGGIKTEVAQFLGQGEDAGRRARVQRRVLAALPRRRLVPRAHGALRVARRPRLREEEDPRRRRQDARRCGSACSSASTANPIRGSSSRRRRSICGSSRRCHERGLESRSAASKTFRCSVRAAWRARARSFRSRCSAPRTTRSSRCSTNARTKAGR